MLGFFHQNHLLPFLLALGLVVAWPAPGFGEGTFTRGRVFWAPGVCSGACEIFDVTGGGDLGTAAGFATVESSFGQIVWSRDLSSAYITEFFQNRVSAISATGAVSTFASGIDRPTGLLRTADDRLLVASFSNGAVYDISGGVDSPPATAFATGLGGARNLLQLATGEILVADQNLGRVIDITAGGSFGADIGFAFGMPGSGPFDLAQDASGRIYASSFSGVFDITAGGDLSGAIAHATGFDFIGLAIEGSGRVLASVLNSGEIYDVTGGGDVSTDIPFAFNIQGFADTALDAIPGSALVVDHFQCYDVKTPKGLPEFEELEVDLSDQFGDLVKIVKKAKRLCTPVDKNGEGIANPEGHLTCYDIKDPKGRGEGQAPKPKFEPFEVRVSNQFGDNQILTVKKPERLCVPSTKQPAESGVAPGDSFALSLDHFLCYKVKIPKDRPRFEPLEVTLSDQFGDTVRLVKKPKSLCTPVDKNGEGILDPDAHLTCYDLKQPKGEPKPASLDQDVLVSNQFGDEHLLMVKKPKTLCVPSEKMDEL